jgi:hypothetical protein
VERPKIITCRSSAQDSGAVRGACRIAAVVAERDEAVEEALDVYGRNLGIAFQLSTTRSTMRRTPAPWAREWATTFATARSPCR